MARILVIDDDPGLARVLARILTAKGHDVKVAPSGEQAVEAMPRFVAEVALIDVNLPGMTGLETFAALRKRQPALVGIFVTAFGSIRSAVEAMRLGGFDYVTKPFDNDEILITLDRALEMLRLSREVAELREEIGSRLAFPGIVGRSPAMLKVLRMLPRLSALDVTVLVLGESGTGKELIARSLHRGSARAAGPFVAINCSAVPVHLFESEFFGHEKGAFTDARTQRIGLFEQAHGGTLFLDEVGDLPMEVQGKLLRVLEDRRVVRLGSRQAVEVDVRVLAATNRDLEAEVAARRFRPDLYYRVNVIGLHLPPLRERTGDLPLLVQHFVDRLNLELGRRVTGVSRDAMARLGRHGWPGNIRELENTLRRAFVMAEEDVIRAGDLTLQPPAPDGGADEAAGPTLTLAEATERAAARVERDLVDDTLSRFGGNRQATCDALGIHRKTLLRKIRQHNLTRWLDPGDPEDEE